MPLTGLVALESWNSLTPGITLRVGPAPCLVSTVELSLMVGVIVNYPEGMSVGELTTPLPWCGTGAGVMPPAPHYLWQLGKLPIYGHKL